MQRPHGPFHSLTADDRQRLRQMLGEGRSLRSVVEVIGCNYRHAWHFAHAEKLIDYRPHSRNAALVTQALTLVRGGLSIRVAATTVGISDSQLRLRARQEGLTTTVSRTQRRINSTNQRVVYLRLRLAGLPKASAATGCAITRRLADDYEKGLVKSGTSQRQRFLPEGPAARTYNRLMTRLTALTGPLTPGQQPEPELRPGVNPYAPINPRYLSHNDRAVIADLHREGHSLRQIGRIMGRSHTSISRELRRNRSPEGPYRPETAQRKAVARRARPQIGKLLANPGLRDYVVDKLRAQWSPEQIANRLRLDYPNDETMRVSHETIYEAFYLESKGRLKDLGLQLPSGRVQRRRRIRRTEKLPTDRFVDRMVLIDERPETVNERILPGHWEGDLILGANNKSAVITLVERVSRFIVLGHLPGRHDSDSVKTALQNTVQRIDESIWSSITWDQGSEMAGHKAFTMATGVPVYFCHPGSPWERGTNENSNGRLRRNLPKSSDLSIYGPEELEMIANIHNHKPRKVLGWLTPAEIMNQALTETGSIT